MHYCKLEHSDLQFSRCNLCWRCCNQHDNLLPLPSTFSKKDMSKNSTSPSKMRTLSFWMHCSDNTLLILRLVKQYQQRLIQVALLTVFTTLGFTAIYLMLFTPTPVYILDRLNLRPFFLPNIMCDGCNNFKFKYLMNNKSACTDQEEVSLFKMVYLLKPDGLVNWIFANFPKMVWMTTVHVLRFRIKHQ